MNLWIAIVGLTLGAAVSGFLTVPLARWVAFRVGAIDLPGKNKIHARPTPRLGGLGILLAFVVSMGVVLSIVDVPDRGARQIGIFLGSLLIMAVLGFVDDVMNLRQWLKLGLEAVVAAALILLLGVDNAWIGVFLWLWILAVLNGYNFLDGVDGLAAGVAALHLVSLAVMFLLSDDLLLATVAGALATAVMGFLPRNWSPASTFMGDIGSLSLGYAISALSVVLLVNHDFSPSAFMATLLAASLSFGDVSLTFFRRLVSRTSLLPEDRGHFYDQAMSKKGWSSVTTVRFSLVVAAVVGALACCILVLPFRVGLGLFLLGIAVVVLAARHLEVSLAWETKV